LSVLSVPEAVNRIVGGVQPMPVERVALLDSLGRVLAAPVVSRLTLPAWDNSAMDGYAVRGADVEGATAQHPRVLRVLETVAAGQFPSRAVAAGEAVRIMTGAPLPSGADSVVRVEDTDGGVEQVVVRNSRDAGRNRRPRGEDLRSGDVVLPAGTPIGPAQIGLLASIGAAVVDVHRRPRVAILGSGDELVDLDKFDEALAGRRIVSSNSYALLALCRSTGAEPVNLGVVADAPEALRDALARSAGCDLLITTAGVSVGEFDHTRDVLASAGAKLDFWRVRMRPGAPLCFGSLGPIPWIGLPGNPVSTMVTSELFVRPALRRMLGHCLLHRQPVPVVLEEQVTIAPGLTHFLRAIVRTGGDGARTARLTGPQGSAILTSMSLANALLVVPEDRLRNEAGETLNALLLTDNANSSHFAL
jgi:molybdopterin molybdotransferase